MRWQHAVCHTEELVSHPYNVCVLLLWHTYEMLRPTYEKATDLMSYGDLATPTYEIVTDLRPYGRVSKSYVWDSYTAAMSYGWDAQVQRMRKQHTLCHTEELVSPTYEIGVLLLHHTDEMLSPTYEIATDLMSCGLVGKSYVWDNTSGHAMRRSW